VPAFIGHGVGAAQMPTEDAVGAPEAVHNFEGFFRCDGMVPAPQGLSCVVGVNKAGPPLTLQLVDGSAGVVEPLLIHVVHRSGGVSGEDLLRH